MPRRIQFSFYNKHVFAMKVLFQSLQHGSEICFLNHSKWKNEELSLKLIL